MKIILLFSYSFVYSYDWPLHDDNGINYNGPRTVSSVLGAEHRGGPDNSRIHGGVDIPADEGTSVYAIEGTVAGQTLSGNAYYDGYSSEGITIGNKKYIHINVSQDLYRYIKVR